MVCSASKLRLPADTRAPRVFARRTGAVLLLLLSAGAHGLAAQERVSVQGRVTDERERPLAGTTVQALDTFWSTTSRADGSFALPLPAGTWRLRIAHLGFRPDTVDVSVREGAPAPLAVRLAGEAVQLPGLTVEAVRTPPLGQTVTPETVRQVPPLGEPDIFRAVVLLPGVSQPNDLKGRIHLAGGASDETGVRLDGHPLQDPFHLLGLFGAFNVAALERADVLVHHLPARMDGRLSGVVDLETQRPGARPAGEAVVSLLTSGLTLAHPALPGGVDVLAAGRVTYLDRAAELVQRNVPAYRNVDFPLLGFGDGLLRLGRSWEGGWRAEALAFATRDRFRDRAFASFPRYEPLTWGEWMGGLRLARTGGPWDLSLRASFNRARVGLDERAANGSTFIDSRRDWSSAAVEAAHTSEHWRASGGVSLDHRSNAQEWFAGALIGELFTQSTPESFRGSQAQTALAFFGETGWQWGGRWSATAGGRLSRVGGGWYAAPRTALAYRASGALRLEAALDRRHQFDAQLEEPIEGSITAPLFLLDEPRTADVAALSARWIPTQAGDLQLQAFYKRYPDRTRLSAGEPRGEASAGFPRFERTPGYSTGAMVSGRRAFGGEGMVQGSYTYQRVREELDGELHPTSWDAPHTLALFGSVPLGRAWVFNAVYQAHSGRATTPVLARIFEPDTRSANSTALAPRYLYGERNSVRVPPYHRLDLGARRSWRGWGAEWTLSLQVLNALFRENPVDYDWGVYFADLQGQHSAPRAGRPGLPIVPSIGLEVKW